MSPTALGLTSILFFTLLNVSAAASASNSTFENPILPGFYPDPSCIFVPEWDNTFFCASSSFLAFPGIPIHASKDLQNWKLIGNVLNREAQLPALATVNSTSGGIWAPTLRFRNGTFWLVTTLVYDDFAQDDASRWDNIIFQSSNPYDESTWSDPVHFTFNGYDTSPFWDTDGKSYMVGSHAWQVYTGETGSWSTLWTGTGGKAPEGPHIYYKDELYYLMIAEGGTGADHMETIARSSHLLGPYTSNPANPVLTAANTTRFFTDVGHADLFQDASDNWWAVALSTRNDPPNDYHPMGRETVLTSVTWETGEWPVFTAVEGVMEGPIPAASLDTLDLRSRQPQLRPRLLPPSTPHVLANPEYLLIHNLPIHPPLHPYTLQLTPSPSNLTGPDAKSTSPDGRGQTFLGRRQQHTLFTFSVDLNYTPSVNNEEAGVTVFLQQNKHVDMGLVLLSGKPYLRVRGISTVALPDYQTALPSTWVGGKLHFEIKAFNWTHYAFSVGLASSRAQMKTLAYPVNSAVGGGFTGTFVGIYATSNGGEGTTPVYFSNWSYIPQGQYVN